MASSLSEIESDSPARRLFFEYKQIIEEKEQARNDFIAAGGDPKDLGSDSDSSTDDRIEELFKKCSGVHIKGVNSDRIPVSSTSEHDGTGLVLAPANAFALPPLQVSPNKKKKPTHLIGFQASRNKRRDLADITKEAEQMYDQLLKWKFAKDRPEPEKCEQNKSNRKITSPKLETRINVSPLTTSKSTTPVTIESIPTTVDAKTPKMIESMLTTADATTTMPVESMTTTADTTTPMTIESMPTNIRATTPMTIESMPTNVGATTPLPIASIPKTVDVNTPMPRGVSSVDTPSAERPVGVTVPIEASLRMRYIPEDAELTKLKPYGARMPILGPAGTNRPKATQTIATHLSGVTYMKTSPKMGSFMRNTRKTNSSTASTQITVPARTPMTIPIVHIKPMMKSDMVMTQMSTSTAEREIIRSTAMNCPTAEIGRVPAENVTTTADKHEDERSETERELRKKLERLFCGNEVGVNGDIFHIVVMNGMPDTTAMEDLSERITFLKVLDRKVVFDFDPEGSIHKYMEERLHQSTRVFPVETFDPSQQNDQTSALFQDPGSTDHNIWIVVNGNKTLEIEEYDIKMWNMRRSAGFREIVRRIEQRVPNGRVVVVFMLFSCQYAIMRKRTEDLISTFGQNWLTVAQTEKTAESWFSHFLECICDKEELETKSVVGLPWADVNSTVLSLMEHIPETPTEIPTSNDTFVTLDDKTKKDWLCIDIVAANQCLELDGVDDFVKRKQQAREEYLRGGEVNWLNFRNGDVLTRTQFGSLKQYVLRKLESNHNSKNYVEVVTLFHQPGAGGTSTASQVLWELKDQYRCAVMKKIVPGQTVKEISTFLRYNERIRPKPVLLLFDNYNEMQVRRLKVELQKYATLESDALGESQSVLYVFLRCVRQTILNRPSTCIPGYFTVEQKLDDTEKKRFGDRSKTLVTKFNENMSHNVNPENLISFNLMKEGFDVTYVTNTVDKLLTEVKDPQETTLLQYVSLLNTFDIHFRAIPLTVFDKLMSSDPQSRKEIKQWERHLSQPLKILLVKRRKRNDYTGIRVCHNVLSQIILDKLRRKGNSSVQEIHEVFNEFLDCPGLFDTKLNLTKERQYVLRIVREIMQQRKRNISGYPETRFSKLIESIRKSAGNHFAADALTKVYQLSNDQFVGQQLARLYIETHNWEKARSLAQQLVDEQQHPHLLDTLGLAHMMEVKACYEETAETSSKLDVDRAQYIMDLAFEGIKIFRKVQKYSECMSSDFQDDTGYFHELANVIHLLNALSQMEVFKEPETLRGLLSGKPVPGKVLRVLKQPYLTRLQKLENAVRTTMVQLKESYQQLNIDWDNELMEHNLTIQTRERVLTRYNEQLSCYFAYAEETYETMSDEERCRYRRCKTNRLAGHNVHTFKDIFDLGRSADGPIKLRKICIMMDDNMTSDFAEPSDLQTYLSATFTLCAYKEHRDELDISNMAYISEQLYYSTILGNNRALEPYLFATMFNWPGLTPSLVKPFALYEVKQVIAKWKEAYEVKYPLGDQCTRRSSKSDTTVAFLGVGQGIEKFIFHTDLPKGSRSSENITAFWRRPDIVNKVEWPQGRLIHDGNGIKLTISQNDINEDLVIPTSSRVTRSEWHHKRVFSIIGFTWAGPRAFCVCREDPRENIPSAAADDLQGVAAATPANETMKLLIELPGKFDTEKYRKEVHDIQKQLEEIQFLKSRKQKPTKEQEEKIRQEERLWKVLKRLARTQREFFNNLHDRIDFHV